MFIVFEISRGASNRVNKPKSCERRNRKLEGTRSRQWGLSLSMLGTCVHAFLLLILSCFLVLTVRVSLLKFFELTRSSVSFYHLQLIV